MHLGQDPELEAIRTRVRKLVRDHAPIRRTKSGVRAPQDAEIPALRAWTAKLYGEQLIGTRWPAEYGGLPGAHPQLESVVAEELSNLRAPLPVGGGMLASAAIVGYGTETQKQFFLPRIRSGADIWCQLFSEPGAGSDLAGLSTRARRDGDNYIVDGQKGLFRFQSAWRCSARPPEWISDRKM